MTSNTFLFYIYYCFPICYLHLYMIPSFPLHSSSLSPHFKNLHYFIIMLLFINPSSSTNAFIFPFWSIPRHFRVIFDFLHFHGWLSFVHLFNLSSTCNFVNIIKIKRNWIPSKRDEKVETRMKRDEKVETRMKRDEKEETGMKRDEKERSLIYFVFIRKWPVPVFA